MGLINFDSVKMSQVRSGKCATCGKRTRRNITVEKTVNPFNRTEQPEGDYRPGGDADRPRVLAEVDMSAGRPKTRPEVAADVRAELEARVKAPLLCTGCEAPP